MIYLSALRAAVLVATLLRRKRANAFFFFFNVPLAACHDSLSACVHVVSHLSSARILLACFALSGSRRTSPSLNFLHLPRPPPVVTRPEQTAGVRVYVFARQGITSTLVVTKINKNGLRCGFLQSRQEHSSERCFKSPAGNSKGQYCK